MLFMASPIVHDVLCEGKVACSFFEPGQLGSPHFKDAWKGRLQGEPSLKVARNAQCKDSPKGPPISGPFPKIFGQFHIQKFCADLPQFGVNFITVNFGSIPQNFAYFRFLFGPSSEIFGPISYLKILGQFPVFLS